MGKYAKDIVALAKSWLGKNENDGTHKTIIDIYNTYKPHPRGYKMQYNIPWCATFISALSIKSGMTDIIPVECSCEEQIKLFKKIGCFVEDESMTPKIGDIVYYDWQDNGNGNNTGWSDHVGIVVAVSRSTFDVIEGNNDNAVKLRTMPINGKFIRGFGVPDYDVETSDETTTKTHTVKDSDTLSSIAKLYNTTVNAIVNANADKIKNPNIIVNGWVLKIPVTGSDSSEKPATPKPSPVPNGSEVLTLLFECLEDIKCLVSYKKLCELLNNRND